VAKFKKKKYGIVDGGEREKLYAAIDEVFQLMIFEYGS